MANIPVTKALVLDPRPLAWLIETTYGAFLIPHEQGIYLPGCRKPIIDPSKQYYRREAKNGFLIEVSITSLSDIRGEVFDDQGGMVLSEKSKARLSEQPDVPVVGMKMVACLVEHLIDRHASVWTRREAHGLEHVWEEFVRPEHRANRDVYCELIDRIHSLTMDLRTEVMQFLGSDQWIMHFLRCRDDDLVVEKSIDFRIYDWTRRMNSGEWL